MNSPLGISVQRAKSQASLASMGFSARDKSLQDLRLGMAALARYRHHITSRAQSISMMALLSGLLGAL